MYATASWAASLSFDGFEERPSSSNMTGHRYDNGPSNAFDDGRDRG
jgi:hypothetical protein